MSNLPFTPVNAAERITCLGESGRTYELNLHPIGTAYYDIPGVYIFCKLGPSGKWDPIYIGETDSLYRRLTEQLTLHHRWASIRVAGATHIATMHVPGGLQLREGIETDIRRITPTPCNLQ